jgi:hypothetical protein
MVEALLDLEARQSIAACGVSGDDGTIAFLPSPSRINAVWRQKVIRWYFTVVAALRRQHAAAVASAVSSAGEGSSSAANPFDRAMVHVSASLLDNYLASLPGERASRYRRDCAAYQLLATTCLLLGMRLAQHDHLIRDEEEEKEGGGGQQRGRSGLKRAKTQRTNMNEVPETAAAVAPPPPARPRAAAMPTASAILRMSAAPKSISERHVIAMARELTGSRAFPRSGVVTALDYVRALSSPATRVVVAPPTPPSSSPAAADDDGDGGDPPVSLGPEDAEEARRLADLALVGDGSFPRRRPCALACAVVSLALLSGRSSAPPSASRAPPLDEALVRRCVHRSVLGRGTGDPGLVRSARAAESDLRALRSAPPSAGGEGRAAAAPPAAHLIPLEDD